MQRKLRNVFLAMVIITDALITTHDSTSAEQPRSDEKNIFYIGTYTSQKSKGIYYGTIDKTTGQIELKGLAAQTVNPSFLAIHPNKKSLYAVNEISNLQGKKAGGVIAFSIDQKTGELNELNQVTSGGTGPCHLALDKSGQFLAVANYGSGSIGLLKINPDGSIGEMTDRIQHTGSGPDLRRQEGPHAHWVGFSLDNRYLFACDLGIDKVLIYRINIETGKLTPAEVQSINLAPGAGPRHMAFHPESRFAYVINELNSTITSIKCDFEKPSFQIIESIKTLPGDFTNLNTTAEIVIHPRGQFVYGSNRGHDSIACFRIDNKSGNTYLSEIIKCGGKTPRNFEITPDGKYLLCANQGSDNITVFLIDENSGKLTKTQYSLEIGSPVCIVFLNK